MQEEVNELECNEFQSLAPNFKNYRGNQFYSYASELQRKHIVSCSITNLFFCSKSYNLSSNGIFVVLPFF